jgi:hypothetical protein
LEVATGASVSKAIDSITLVFFLLKEKHTYRVGLLRVSKYFLRIFTDTTNHVPHHRRLQSVFAFSRFTLHLDLPYLVRFNSPNRAKTWSSKTYFPLAVLPEHHYIL